jgi:hypothetical protein
MQARFSAAAKAGASYVKETNIMKKTIMPLFWWSAVLLICMLFNTANAQVVEGKYADVDLRSLPSGQLQAIDWEQAELTINGKVYSYNRDALQVFYDGKETDLASLAANAQIHFQSTIRQGSETIVRIWVSAGGLIPS